MHRSLRSPRQGVALLFVCVCVNSHPGTVSRLCSASWAEMATDSRQRAANENQAPA